MSFVSFSFEVFCFGCVWLIVFIEYVSVFMFVVVCVCRCGGVYVVVVVMVVVGVIVFGRYVVCRKFD